MVRRLPPLALIALAILALTLAIGPSPAARAQARPISCPNGATVWLEGQAPPNEALLAYLEKRSVGGGSSDRSGRFRIPLRLRERPGIYSVEVRTRASRALVGSFQCYVDVPLTSQPTPTPEIVVTAAPAAPATTATRATAGTPSPTTARTTTTTTARTTTTTARTATATRTATAARTINAATATTTATPGPSPTGQSVGEDDVQITDIVLFDPEYPDEPEYVEIVNATVEDIVITGWRLVNISRPDRPTYIFPSYTLDDGGVVLVYTGAGEDDPIIGDFYWNRSDTVWEPGNVAELRDRQNRLIASFTVVIQ